MLTSRIAVLNNLSSEREDFGHFSGKDSVVFSRAPVWRVNRFSRVVQTDQSRWTKLSACGRATNGGSKNTQLCSSLSDSIVKRTKLFE